jgi:CRP-like cAMP-binding protein
MMHKLLVNHIKRYIDVSDAASKEIEESFVVFDLQKRQLVVSEGELCTHLYFVAKGCLRLFYLDEKGMEQTIQFALENWWMTDIDAFNRKGKSSYSIQAVENTTLFGIAKNDWDNLLEKNSDLEKYFRVIYERAYSASLFRMKMFRLSKDDFYNLFCDKYPEFIQRIPQKILASFLGFTPEYLSELRKKKLSERK